ncbi:FUSC family protein [Novosphingobium sp. PP1Y]|uniref:FUSC family protein n=1 Tax=Novosphingobium sp. PP1Y TaxID=702113 RepID=UPI001E5FD78A|nr:FUSC family protein [Novosphingobium sp. PP1Y]
MPPSPQDTRTAPLPDTADAGSADQPARISARLRSELRALITPGPRMADEWACVASVLLSIVFAHLIGAKMIAWAAFSAYVLLKSDVGETLLRGVLRMTGTSIGILLAVLLVPMAANSLPMAMVCAGVIGALGLYGMLTARRAYAWLLFGLTFEMILLDKLERPGLDTIDFAHTRLLEVAAGTMACTIVSIVAALLARQKWLGFKPDKPKRITWNPVAARHAAQAGVALAALPALHAILGLRELAQAGITILVVMIVPVSGIGPSGFIPVTRRLFHRALGSLAGGALALGVLAIAHGSPPLLIAGTCLGIVLGRHLENGLPSVTYIGLQFTLTVLIVLIPDSYENVAIEPALMRLASAFIGMIVLEPVLLAWHLIAPRKAAHAKQEP